VRRGGCLARTGFAELAKSIRSCRPMLEQDTAIDHCGNIADRRPEEAMITEREYVKNEEIR